MDLVYRDGRSNCYPAMFETDTENKLRATPFPVGVEICLSLDEIEVLLIQSEVLELA